MNWKMIPKTEDRYLISDKGVVKSLSFIKKGNKSKYQTKEKIISLGVDKNGYKIFVCSINSVRKSFRVHRLVAEAFLPNPYNLPIINHKDGNPSNNNLLNLEWCDNSHNIKDAIERGTLKPTLGEINGMSKLNTEQVLEIRSSEKSRKELSKLYQVSVEAIGKIIRRERWKHI